MNQKTTIILTGLVLIVLSIFIIYDFSRTKGGSLQNSALSPHILLLTQPVTSFSGVVEQIQGDTIIVTQNQFRTDKDKTKVSITYSINTSKKTQVYQKLPNVNYLFKQVSIVPPKSASKQDIKVGSYIVATSPVDLRMVKTNIFETDTITIVDSPNIVNTLSGVITELKNDSITLKAPVPAVYEAGKKNNPPLQEKNFVITIDPNTEISRMSFITTEELKEQTPSSTEPKPQKLNVADLKVGMQATIYTDNDVLDTSSLTALRIDPMIK